MHPFVAESFGAFVEVSQTDQPGSRHSRQQDFAVYCTAVVVVADVVIPEKVLCIFSRHTHVQQRSLLLSRLSVSTSDASSEVVEVARSDAALMIGFKAFLILFLRRLRWAAAASTNAAVMSEGAKSTDPNSPDTH